MGFCDPVIALSHNLVKNSRQKLVSLLFVLPFALLTGSNDSITLCNPPGVSFMNSKRSLLV